ncbi:hypothetical protein KQI84_19355, partial [bacterium]|nr:hypothetical protein [bacterium]
MKCPVAEFLWKALTIIERDMRQVQQMLYLATKLKQSPNEIRRVTPQIRMLQYQVEGASESWVSEVVRQTNNLEMIADFESNPNWDTVRYHAEYIEHLARSYLSQLRSDERLACRICGLVQEDMPWGEDQRSPSFGFCSCCGAVFGNEDDTLESAREFRQEWLRRGANWLDPDLKPPDWNCEAQLRNVPSAFRMRPTNHIWTRRPTSVQA